MEPARRKLAVLTLLAVQVGALPVLNFSENTEAEDTEGTGPIGLVPFFMCSSSSLCDRSHDRREHRGRIAPAPCRLR